MTQNGPPAVQNADELMVDSGNERFESKYCGHGSSENTWQLCEILIPPWCRLQLHRPGGGGTSMQCTEVVTRQWVAFLTAAIIISSKTVVSAIGGT